jgi:hypothetical protein
MYRIKGYFEIVQERWILFFLADEGVSSFTSTLSAFSGTGVSGNSIAKSLANSSLRHVPHASDARFGEIPHVDD